MRKLSFLRIVLLAALVALFSRAAQAQDATGPGSGDTQPGNGDWNIWAPLNNRPDLGGFFISSEFVMMRQTNPIGTQQVAIRGFKDVDGSISAALGLPPVPGNFFGSAKEALNTNQVSGPNGFSPGTIIDLGYKFDNGSEIYFSWMYLAQHRTLAAATAVPYNFAIGADQADSFLYSPVYNFPNDYAGSINTFKLPIGSQFAAYGIWNGASIETETFIQRTQQYEVTWREPIFETENYRLSGIVGGRFFWIWEKFEWRAMDLDFATGAGGPLDTAIYSNIDSNRMYGPHAGVSQECYIGHGFACQVDLDAAMFVDVVRERAQYTTGAKYGIPQVTAESKRSLTVFEPAPELDCDINLVWYPIKSVEVRIGYNAMAFFNTISSPQPIDFNYGALTPAYKSTFRLFDGFNVGMALNF